jgi:hypothetical protein
MLGGDEGGTTPFGWTAIYPVGTLVLVVLGVLSIAGEYSTGSIRTSIVAAPRRTGVLLAKAAVVTGVTAVLPVVTSVLLYLLVQIAGTVPSAKGLSLFDPDMAWAHAGPGRHRRDAGNPGAQGSRRRSVGTAPHDLRSRRIRSRRARGRRAASSPRTSSPPTWFPPSARWRAGDAVIAPSATRRLLDRLASRNPVPRAAQRDRGSPAVDQLTARERQILVAIGEG